GEMLQTWKSQYPLLQDILQLEPVVWLHPFRDSIHDTSSLPIKKEDVVNADKLWNRFIPFLKKAFSETNGVIESPLRLIPSMKEKLSQHYEFAFKGDLYLKCDNELPIAGSIKARGGIYEVLQ